jgi:hypothetical protein
LRRGLAAWTEDVTEYSVGKTTFVERLLRVAREPSGLAFPFAVPTAKPN